MHIQQLITEALNLPTNAISYHISQELAAIYPEKVLLEGNDSTFFFRLSQRTIFIIDGSLGESNGNY